MAFPSSSSSFIYDVFLSFRGEETRHYFTGYLYKALQDKGIHTFIDDEKLQSGEEITPALLNAIEESRIAITVLSKDYASSSFCLDELATILHCKTKGLLVIPVFYKVDPSDVRHQKGSYGEALAKHQKRFKAEKEKLQKWMMALRQIADFSGYHYKDGIEYEHKFIERIVERVSREINSGPLHIADDPVGLESKIKNVKKLLDLRSHDVIVIGIHGMGGIGKSTLARAVYNLITDNFEESCFLQNVREESNKYGLKHLQSIILSKILREKDITLASWQEGASMIQQRLRRKKVLLILDDVDKLEQLKAFVGRPDWLGPGSRVIITTRDQHLLTSHGINRTFEVEKLESNYAHQLLISKAFKTEKFDARYEKVLHDAVVYASGLPLALEVIGSNLVGKGVKEWVSALQHYKRIPPGEILEILKVSFDALGEEEKSVFLDISCCLKGFKLTEIELMLRALYDYNMKYHIGVLVEKSLIKISNVSTVEMHDLIQDMGRQIDQKESPKEPGKRRRLWLPRDITHVLEENTGTSKIEIICLDFSVSEKEETVECNENTFMEMENLTILIIRNVKFSKAPNYFPESLKVLEWHGYPSNCLPYNFDPNNLVICKLPDSCFTSFGFPGSSKNLENLTILNFDNCKLVTRIPDVSHLSNLEELSFKWCKSLIAVHGSVGFLAKLKILKAKGCWNLKSFPHLNLSSLEILELSSCFSLENFPEILGKMGNIRELSLHNLPIKELPVSFQNFTGLQKLIVNCSSLRLNPIVLTPELTDISVHDFDGWQWIKSGEKVSSIISTKVDAFWALSCKLNDDFFSAGFTQLALVRDLCLDGTNITFLPKCIKEFHNLFALYVNDCKRLEEIRAVPPNLRLLRALNCISLTSSSSSMLLNKQHHEARRTSFVFPGASIPWWFRHQRRGASISFWFRNEFPDRTLCLLIAPVLGIVDLIAPMLFINGKVINPYYRNQKENMSKLDYTHIFDLNDIYLQDDIMKVSLKNEWNHVEVTYEGVFDTSHIKAFRIHVVKEEGRSMEDIRYVDPHINTKRHNQLNTSQSQNHSFFKNIALRFFIGSFYSFLAFYFFILFTSLRTNPA